MRKRGFEVVEAYAEKNIHLPQRQTKTAAGYDFEAAEEIVLPSFWKLLFMYSLGQIKAFFDGAKCHEEEVDQLLKPRLVPTGIKAYMGDDEYLQLANRSSNPLKHRLILPNGVGIVDSDYYNNPNNEGHIQFQLMNYGLRDYTIKKGERIGQGIFLPFLKADGDQSVDRERTGGFGSSKR
ncbi:dUTP diphosphatase [Atopobacter sp. AH10]|uniref:dUTP diphosphatase n=1 Tax=Atopobacter sp. AH10 TaxID=2315861 RepID=UPI000EF28B80|nr:dUTP diphosphatase [Atopobacter sp. AH10]RLK62810.1 dUTP diphosphatase [Atopobacter sp. AH10]